MGDIKYSFRRNTPLCHILCLTDFGPRSLTITYQQKLVSNNFSLSSFQLENLIQCLLYNVTFCTTYMYYTFCWMQHQSKEFFFFFFSYPISLENSNALFPLIEPWLPKKYQILLRNTQNIKGNSC